MRRLASLAAIALSILALALSFSGDAVPTARATAAIAAAALLPGFCVLRLLVPNRLGAPLELALTLAISPFALGAVMTALTLGGFSALAAGRIALVLLASGLGWDLYRSRSVASPAPPDDERETGVAAVLAAIVMTLLLAYPLATSNRVRASIHGMLHASVLYEAVDRGVPPENPFFAGEPLRYYWTYHVAMAAPCYVGAVEPTIVFAAASMAALLAFLLLLARLGADLFPHRGSALLAVLLGMLALNPLGAFLFEQNAPERQGFASLAELAGGADPIRYLQALAVGADDRITATLTKFMNVSSFPQALALLAAMWLLLARTATSPGRSNFLLAALTVAGTITLSPITGLTAGLSLGLAAILLGAVAFMKRCENRPGWVLTTSAMAAGLAAAVPFVLLGGGGSEGTVQWAPTLEKTRTALMNLGPALLLAVPAAWFIARRGKPGSRLLLLSLPPLILLGIVLWFPVNSEYKMVRMAAPLLGVLAAGSVVLLTHRRAWPAMTLAGAALIAFFLPTNVMAWRAYDAHRAASLAFHGAGPDIVLDTDVHSRGEMYQWIRDNTPDDAIIIDSSFAWPNHFAGPFHGAETPVVARRPVFTDRKFYMNNYEADIDRRLDMLTRLFSGQPWGRVDYEYLAGLRRPVYLLLRSSDRNLSRAAAALQGDPSWEKAHQTKSAFLFQLRRSHG